MHKRRKGHRSLKFDEDRQLSEYTYTEQLVYVPPGRRDWAETIPDWRVGFVDPITGVKLVSHLPCFYCDRELSFFECAVCKICTRIYCQTPPCSEVAKDLCCRESVPSRDPDLNRRPEGHGEKRRRREEEEEAVRV